MSRTWKKRISEAKLRKVLTTAHLAIPYLFVMSYVFILLETYSYPGYLGTILLVDAKLFSLISLVVAFAFASVWVLSVPKDVVISDQDKLVFGLNRLLTPVFFFFSFLFEYLEKDHFPNYVFSNFHLHPYNFKLLLLLSIAIILLEFVLKNRQKMLFLLNVKMSLSFVSSLVITAVLGWYSLLMLVSLFQDVALQGIYIVQHPFISYDQKMEKAISLFTYFTFVKEHTPPDAIIAVPPQKNPWLTEGNVGYTRYFLYPRRIITDSDQNKVAEGAQYALLARGEWASHDGKYGWPRATVSAEKVWYFDSNTKVSTESSDVVVDWINQPESHESWGLIKLKTQ